MIAIVAILVMIVPPPSHGNIGKNEKSASLSELEGLLGLLTVAKHTEWEQHFHRQETSNEPATLQVSLQL